MVARPQAGPAALQEAITARLCRFIEDELGLGSGADAPAQQAAALMRLLRVSRPVQAHPHPHQQPAQPGAPQGEQRQQQQQPLQGEVPPPDGTAASQKGPHQHGAASSSNSSGSSSGGSRSSGGGDAGAGGRASVRVAEALFPGPPVALCPPHGLAELVQRVAAQLAGAVGEGVGAERLTSATHVQVSRCSDMLPVLCCCLLAAPGAWPGCCGGGCARVGCPGCCGVGRASIRTLCWGTNAVPHLH